MKSTHCVASKYIRGIKGWKGKILPQSDCSFVTFYFYSGGSRDELIESIFYLKVVFQLNRQVQGQVHVTRGYFNDFANLPKLIFHKLVMCYVCLIDL